MRTDVQTTVQKKLQKVLCLGGLTLLLVMPLHAFLVIVLGRLLGHRAIFQAWKEVLIVVMAILATIIALDDRPLFKRIVGERINQVVFTIIIIGLLTTLEGLASGSTTVSTVLFGLKITLLPFVLFIVMQFSSTRFWSDSFLEKLVLIPSAVVALGALVQTYLLPVRWLTSLGYNSTTIIPVQLVDPAVKSIRAFSTLGGPNQLGAYMILPSILTCILFIQKRRFYYVLIVTLTIWASILSFSRSAWIGLVVGILTMTFLVMRASWRKVFVLVLAAVTLIAIFVFTSGLLPKQLGGTTVQYYLLHGRYNAQNITQIEGSNSAHAASLQHGLDLALKHPLGLGIGAAGPASFHGNNPIITENWYIQIALELGIIGLGLVICFFIMVAMFLSKGALRDSSALALSLYAGLIGICVTNLFLHAWADSTLAITFFTLMGIMRGRYDKT